jgi:hypothetical protein
MNLSLKEMTTLDKLSLMEQLWDDLCSNPASIPSPTNVAPNKSSGLAL